MNLEGAQDQDLALVLRTPAASHLPEYGCLSQAEKAGTNQAGVAIPHWIALETMVPKWAPFETTRLCKSQQSTSSWEYFPLCTRFWVSPLVFVKLGSRGLRYFKGYGREFSNIFSL